MRILSTISLYTPYVSGLTLCAKRVLDSMVIRGHQATVITMQHDSSLSLEEKVDGVAVKRVVPSVVISKGFIAFGYLGKIVQEIQQCDVVIINLPQFEGILTAIVAKLFRKPIVVVYHCEIVLPQGVTNRLIQFVLDCSHRVQLGLATQIVTYTEDYAKSSRLLSAVLTRVQAIAPPVPYLPAEKKIQQQLQKKILPHTIVLGVASRLAREKGIEYLLDALPALNRQNQSFMVLVAGPLRPLGEEDYRQLIMEKVKQYKDQVIFLDTLSQAQMGSFYECIDILVLPSVNATEAFGMVQIEAMEHGVPVITTDLPGVRVPIQQTGMGKIVPIRDSEAIIEAINNILKKKGEYRKQIENVKKLFGFERSIDAYEKVLNFLLSSCQV